MNQRNHKLAISVKSKCISSKKNEEGMTVYQLPLSKAMQQTPTQFSFLRNCIQMMSLTDIKRFSFGEPYQANGRERKTILLMGETGSGKTTWINAMINYVLGVEWGDPFRFKLIDEEVKGGSQVHSQTQEVTAYDIHYRDGFRVPFSLTIVDTPGFGDTRGIQCDNDIKSALQTFFQHRNGIQEFHAVGFVIQSSMARLTISTKYIFESALSIFGKDVKENIRFLTTFADGKRPLVLEAIKEAQFPCKIDRNGLPCHQKFNNGAIYINNQDDDDEYSPIEWKNGMKNFKLFFDELSDMPTKSLQMTKEVLKDRKQLEMKLNWLQNVIPDYLTQIEELQTYEELIDKYRDKVYKNRHFERQVTKIMFVKVSTGNLSALNCKNCLTTCHHPCDPSLPVNWCPVFNKPENGFFGFIATAFLLFEGNCNVCPDECRSSDHVHESQRWTQKEVTVTKTLHDVYRKYENAKRKMINAKEMAENLKEETDELEERINEAMDSIVGLRNKLKNIALCDNPLADPEYIKMMIENENQNRSWDCERRIGNLKKLLALAQMTSKIVEEMRYYRRHTLGLEYFLRLIR